MKSIPMSSPLSFGKGEASAVTTAATSSIESTSDTVASSALAAEVDRYIDMDKLNSDGERLMVHLAARYEEAICSLIPGGTSNGDAAHDMFRLLARQIARAKADIFVLKSALLARDKLVLTRDWNYEDPLAALSVGLGEDVRSVLLRSEGRHSVPITDRLVGFGWHQTERDGSRQWRWSGPNLTSGIMVPRIVSGVVVIEISFAVLKTDALPAQGGIRVDGKDVEYEVAYTETPTKGTIRLKADLSQSSAAFFALEFVLQRTYSPFEELGAEDYRQLGVCLLGLDIVLPSGRTSDVDRETTGGADSVTSPDVDRV
jgi:hypothetical protein